MTATNSHKTKVFISYAWGGESERIAIEVEKALSEKGLEIVRDKSGGLDYKGLIKEFMQEIGKGNFVIVIISDKYLRSENCMFELIEIAKNGSFAQRIFPIILEDARIYKPIQRVKYLKHWEKQITELNDALKELQDVADIADIQEELSFYKEIRKEIAGLAGQLKNMNTLTPEMHQKSNFQQIYEQIESELKAKAAFGKKEEKLKAQVQEKVIATDYEYDVFLSFSSKDEDFVKAVSAELRAYNLRVFMSNDSLAKDAGKPFFERINHALGNSQHFLLASTPNAMQSGWVQHEYSSFFSQQYIPSKGKRKLMILKGPDFEFKLLPQLLRTIQASESVEQVIKQLVRPSQLQNKIQEEEKLKQQLKQQKLEQAEEKLWEETKTRDTREAYEQYLIRSELKKFARKARELINTRRLEEIAADAKKKDDEKWNNAKQENSIEAYNDYLSCQKKGKYSEDARRKINELIEKEYNEIKVKTPVKEIYTKPKPVLKTLDLLEMVFVEGGTYMMGYDPKRDGEDKYMDPSKPLHQVQVNDFYIGKYEVTQAQWRNVMGENPSYFKDCDKCPVEQVSWNEVQDFIKKLNQQTGGNYRLPTEAEWEFAARGGNLSKGYRYAGSNTIDEVAWYKDNAENRTHNVGYKRPNELGVYDMSGNVWEWCEDDWHGDFRSAPSDGSAWMDESNRNPFHVLRGGSWVSYSHLCNITYRNLEDSGRRYYSNGFRLAASLC